MKRVLIVTHSDASTDSRIIKTHDVAKSAEMKTMSLGVRDTNVPATQPSNSEVILLNNIVRSLRDRFRIEPQPGSFVSKALLVLIYLELSTRMIIRGAAFRPNVIHCNDWMVLPIAAVLKFLTGARLIYDAHELESRADANPSTPGSLVERIERFLWPRVDFFTTVSPSIDSWYRDNYGEKPSAVILNSPKIPEGFRPDSPRSDYFRKKFNIPVSTKIYIYIGMLGFGRGIDTTLEVFCRTTTDSAVVFLGYGEHQDRIEKLAKVRRNIFFHEKVNHLKVVDLARSADYGLCLIENVSLSDYFCIPNKLLEYAFAGIPVVASKLPEIQRIVQTYELGECFDNTIEELLNVLVENSRTESVPQPNSRNLEELSWDNQASKLKSIFKSVSGAGK